MKYLPLIVLWNLIAILGGACSVVSCYHYVCEGSYSGVVWNGICALINTTCACLALDAMRNRDAVYSKTQWLVWWWRSKWRMRWFKVGLSVRATFAIVYMLGYMAVRFAYHLAKKRGRQGARWHMSRDVSAWSDALKQRELARAERESQIGFDRIMGLMDLHQEMVKEELGPEKYRKLMEDVKADLAKREEES